MIVRMYIEAHIAGLQLSWGMAHYVTGYLSGELPAILFGQLGGVLEKGGADEAALPGIPGFCFLPGGGYVFF